jgi:sarcosine oxidase
MTGATNVADTIVVGLGAVGGAIAHQLSRRGHAVLGIDRYVPPHNHGSSHGETRITRLAIGEGEHFSPFAIRSHELWREIEREAGTRLLTVTGGLIISSPRTSTTIHVPGFLDTTVAAARRYGIPHEVLSAAEIRRRYPAFHVHDEETGYYEPDAGYLRPEACVATQLTLAERRGAVLRYGEAVLEVSPRGSRAVVRTESGSYLAERVVLAAGPWAPGLLAPEVARHFTVTRQLLCWFAPESAVEPFLPGRFPVFIWEPAETSEPIYGFPAIEGAAGGVKVASGAYGERVTPDGPRRPVTGEEVGRLYETLVAPCFPGLSARCLKAVSCLYTVTPDAGFVVDRLPGFPQVILVSPCSGHGFKHSAAVGEAVAEWIVDGRTRLDLSPFRLDRLAAASS